MRHLLKERAFIAALFALGSLGCSKSEKDGQGPVEPPPAAQPAVAMTPDAEARAIFNERCARCHGQDGKGNGSQSAGLSPRPRDYTSAEWQKSVTEEDLRAAIVKGGPAIGRSPLMPASPELASRPEVVTSLVKIVRGFGK